MQEMAEAAWGMASCAACLCMQMVLSRNRGKCLFSPDIVRLEFAPSGIEDECQAGSGEYDAAEGRSFDTEDGVKGKAGLRSCAGSDAEERERGRVARVRKAEEHGLREVPGCMAAECCPELLSFATSRQKKAPTRKMLRQEMRLAHWFVRWSREKRAEDRTMERAELLVVLSVRS